MRNVSVQFKSEKSTTPETSESFKRFTALSDEQHERAVRALLDEVLEAELELVAELGVD